MKYIKHFEAIVKTDDLTKVELEGEVLEVIEKHLTKIGIKSRDQFKKEADETLDSIEDIWREVGYDFPDINIKFERYLYDVRSNTDYYGRKNSDFFEQKFKQNDLDIEKSIIVKLQTGLYDVIYSNAESREIEDLVKDCIDRCKTFAKLTESKSSISRSINCVFSFTTDFGYEYYDIYSNKSGKILTIKSFRESYFKTGFDYSGRYHRIYDILSDGLRKELRSMGYGLLMSRGGSTGGYDYVDIEVFKLKKSENED